MGPEVLTSLMLMMLAEKVLEEPAIAVVGVMGSLIVRSGFGAGIGLHVLVVESQEDVLGSQLAVAVVWARVIELFLR